MADDTQQNTNLTPTPQAATTSPTQVPAQTPVGDPASKKPSGDEPNPLDVLEKLLDEIDQGKDGGKPSAKDLVKQGQASGEVKPSGPTPEEIAAEELEKQRLKYEKIKAEQQVIDQKLIEEQREALNNEMQTGEANVARAQQDEEKEKTAEQRDQADDGYEVVQLDHTKI